MSRRSRLKAALTDFERRTAAQNNLRAMIALLGVTNPSDDLLAATGTFVSLGIVARDVDPAGIWERSRPILGSIPPDEKLTPMILLALFEEGRRLWEGYPRIRDALSPEDSREYIPADEYISKLTHTVKQVLQPSEASC